MNLNDIKKTPLSRKKATRVGRGPGSGKGGTSGKGHDGQRSRSGVTLPLVFEGGNMPLYRRLPIRGFNNRRFQDNWVIVNVSELNKLSDGQEVNLEELTKAGILKVQNGKKHLLKILGDGELNVKKLKVKAHKVSATAKQKIEANNGEINLIARHSSQKNDK